MKRYLKKRYKNYVNLVFGLLIGFILITLLFDKPDYKSAILSASIGLIVGEIFVFLKWSKEAKERK